MPDASKSDEKKEPYKISPGDQVIWKRYESMGELCGPATVSHRIEEDGKTWLVLEQNPSGTLAISLSLVRKVKPKEEKGKSA